METDVWKASKLGYLHTHTHQGWNTHTHSWHKHSMDWSTRTHAHIWLGHTHTELCLVYPYLGVTAPPRGPCEVCPGRLACLQSPCWFQWIVNEESSATPWSCQESILEKERNKCLQLEVEDWVLLFQFSSVPSFFLIAHVSSGRIQLFFLHPPCISVWSLHPFPPSCCLCSLLFVFLFFLCFACVCFKSESTEDRRTSFERFGSWYGELQQKL